MKRITICSTILFALFLSSSPAFAQNEQTPLADKIIRETITALKKKQASLKNASEKAKLAKAIASLELSLMPPAAEKEEKAPVAVKPKIVEDPAKVTRENYGKLKTGMNLSEVEGILGKGKEESSDRNITRMVWRSSKDRGAVVISITFEFRVPGGGAIPTSQVPLYTTIISKDIRD